MSEELSDSNWNPLSNARWMNGGQRSKLDRLSWLGVAMGIAGASFAFSQMAATSSPALYTSTQAKQGKALYADKCAVCHGDKLEGGVGPALSGETFSQAAAAEQMTAKSLFTKISTTMPTGAPASLKQEEYEALLAYLLQTNGFPDGSKPFSKEAPGLDQVKIGQAATAGGAAAAHPASSGVYVAAQAARGKALYANSCAVIQNPELTSGTQTNCD